MSLKKLPSSSSADAFFVEEKNTFRDNEVGVFEMFEINEPLLPRLAAVAGDSLTLDLLGMTRSGSVSCLLSIVIDEIWPIPSRLDALFIDGNSVVIKYKLSELA